MSDNPAVMDGSSASAPSASFDPTAKLLELAAKTQRAAAPAAVARTPAPGSAFANGEQAEEPSAADLAKTAARRAADAARVTPEVTPGVTPEVAAPVVKDGLLRPPADVKAPVAPAAYDPVKDPEAPIEVQGGKDQKSINAWTKIKRREKELERLLSEKEAALSDASKVKPVELEELAAMKKRVEEADAKIGQLSITESRAFKERYEAPLQGLFSRGVGILVRAGKPQEEAVSTMRELVKPGMTQDQVQELLGDVAPAYQGAVVQTTFDLQEAVAKREQAVVDWKATKAALSDGEQRTSMADLSKMLVEGTTAAAERLAQEQSWMFVESKENPAWNAQREGIISAARVVLRENRPDELLKYVLEGVASSKYRAFAEAESKRAEQLQAELDKRTGLRPRVGGTTVLTDQSAPVEKPKAQPFEAWAAQNAAKFVR